MDVKGSVFGQERARPLRSCGIIQGEFRFEVEILLLEQWKEKEFKEQRNLIGVKDIFCPKEIIEKLITGKMIAVLQTFLCFFLCNEAESHQVVVSVPSK